jgi:hypothetical protein
MTRADKALVFLLRFVGVPALFALVAVVMPFSWMVATHRWLGLGDMPNGRSWSTWPAPSRPSTPS